MRIPLVAWLVCSAALPGLQAGGFLDFFLPKHELQVITVTDTTPMGALMRPATPANPVYYIAVNMGYRDLGGVMGGDKIPPQPEVLKTFFKVLAKQGYLPSSKDHPPTMLMLWVWGTMYTDKIYMSSDDFEGRQLNRHQLLRFLGGYKLGLTTKTPELFTQDILPGVTHLNADAQDISDLATDDLYVAVVAAYDYQSVVNKEKKLLWTTKISCPARGFVLGDVLPSMLAIAGPNIGRETAKPVWVNASEKFKPEVKIGDPVIVEYLTSNKLPVVDASQSKLGKPAAKKPADKSR
ncbi:MAG: hypothetical protein HZA31_05025 [Opitutae bacterium]|nr:hypothetical protein [Opitutae bacterium]